MADGRTGCFFTCRVIVLLPRHASVQFQPSSGSVSICILKLIRRLVQ